MSRSWSGREMRAWPRPFLPVTFLLVQDKLLFRVRCLVAFFIFGLVISGVTAFPLLHELEILASLLGIARDGVPSDYAGLQFWIAHVREGLRETYARFPFLAYGTDWLAFGRSFS